MRACVRGCVNACLYACVWIGVRLQVRFAQTLSLICTLFRDNSSKPVKGKPPAAVTSTTSTTSTATVTAAAIAGAGTSDEQQMRFSEKLCTFALIRHGRRGAHTVAKCKVDMSPFADVPADRPTKLTLLLSKGSEPIASLELSIASKWLKEMQAP
eukprot:4632899-Pleurochrysis_carterae.AAC.1